MESSLKVEESKKKNMWKLLHEIIRLNEKKFYNESFIYVNDILCNDLDSLCSHNKKQNEYQNILLLLFAKRLMRGLISHNKDHRLRCRYVEMQKKILTTFLVNRPSIFIQLVTLYTNAIKQIIENLADNTEIIEIDLTYIGVPLKYWTIIKELKYVPFCITSYEAYRMIKSCLLFVTYAQNIGYQIYPNLFYEALATIKTLNYCGWKCKLGCLLYFDSLLRKHSHEHRASQVYFKRLICLLYKIWRSLRSVKVHHVKVYKTEKLSYFSVILIRKIKHIIQSVPNFLRTIKITILSDLLVQTLFCILKLSKELKYVHNLKELKTVYINVIFLLQISTKNCFQLMTHYMKVLQKVIYNHSEVILMLFGASLPAIKFIHDGLSVCNIKYLDDLFSNIMDRTSRSYNELKCLHVVLNGYYFLRNYYNKTYFAKFNSCCTEYKKCYSKFEQNIILKIGKVLNVVLKDFQYTRSLNAKKFVLTIKIELIDLILKIDILTESLTKEEINMAFKYIDKPIYLYFSQSLHRKNLYISNRIITTSFRILLSTCVSSSKAFVECQKVIEVYSHHILFNEKEKNQIFCNLKNVFLLHLPKLCIKKFYTKEDIFLQYLAKLPSNMNDISVILKNTFNFSYNDGDFTSLRTEVYNDFYFQQNIIDEYIYQHCQELILIKENMFINALIKHLFFQKENVNCLFILKDKHHSFLDKYIDNCIVPTMNIIKIIPMITNTIGMNTSVLKSFLRKVTTHDNLTSFAEILLKSIHCSLIQNTTDQKQYQMHLIKICFCCTQINEFSNDWLLIFCKMAIYFIIHPRSLIIQETYLVILEICQYHLIQPSQLWNWYKTDMTSSIAKIIALIYLRNGIRIINSLKYFTKVIGFTCVQEFTCKSYKLILTSIMPLCIERIECRGLIIAISKNTRKSIKTIFIASFLRIYRHIHITSVKSRKKYINVIANTTCLTLNDLLLVNVQQSVAEIFIHFNKNPQFVFKTLECLLKKKATDISSHDFIAFISNRFLGIITYLQTCIDDLNIEKSLKEEALCSFGKIIQFVGMECVTKFRLKIITILEFILALKNVRLQLISLKIWKTFVHTVNFNSILSSIGTIAALLQRLLHLDTHEVNSIYRFIILKNGKACNRYMSGLYFLVDNNRIAPIIRNRILHQKTPIDSSIDIIGKLKFYYKEICSINVETRIYGIMFLQNLISSKRNIINQLVLDMFYMDPLLENILDVLVSSCLRDEYRLQLTSAKCIGVFGAVDPSYLPLKYFKDEKSKFIVGIQIDEFAVFALKELCRAYQLKKGTKYVDNFCLAIQETLSVCGISPKEKKKMHIWESFSTKMKQIMTPFLTSCYATSRQSCENTFHPIFNSVICRSFSNWAFLWATRLINFIKRDNIQYLFNSYKPSIKRDNNLLVTFFPYLLIYALEGCSHIQVESIFEELQSVFMSYQKNILKQSTCRIKICKEFLISKYITNSNSNEIRKYSLEKYSSQSSQSLFSDCLKFCSEMIGFLQRWLNEWQRVNDSKKIDISTNYDDNLNRNVQKLLLKFNKYIIARANFNINDLECSLLFIEDYIIDDSTNRLHEQISFLIQIYLKLGDTDSVEGAMYVKRKSLDMPEKILFNKIVNRSYELKNCFEALMSLHTIEMEQDSVTGIIDCYLSMETPETALLISEGLWKKCSNYYSEDFINDCKLKLFVQLGLYEELKEILDDTFICNKTTNWNVQCAQIFVLFRLPISIYERDYENNNTAFQNWVEKLDQIRFNVLTTMQNCSTPKPFFTYLYFYEEAIKFHLIMEAEDLKRLLQNIFVHYLGKTTNQQQLQDYKTEINLFFSNWEKRLELVQPSASMMGIVLQFRRNLLMEAQQAMLQTTLFVGDILNNITNIFDLEIGNLWLRSVQMYNDAGSWQQAHMCLLKAEQFSPKTFHLYKVKLLWKMGDQTNSLKLLDENLEQMDLKCNSNFHLLQDDERFLYAETKFLQAFYSAESTNTYVDLNLRHFKKAISVNNKAEKFHIHLAHYMEKIYNAYSTDQKNSENGRKIILEIMLSYAKSLRCGVINIYQSLPRLLSFWFNYTTKYSKITKENCTNFQYMSPEELIRKINDLLNNCANILYTPIFFTAFSQLLSRICHQCADVFRILQTIFVKLILCFPHQSLWKFLPIIKSFNNFRVKRCKIVLTDSRLSDPIFQKHLTDFNMITEKLIELTNKELPLTNTSGVYSLVKQLPMLLTDSSFTKLLLPFEKHMQIIFPTQSDSNIILSTATETKCNFWSKTTNSFPFKQVFICGINDEIIVLRSAAKPKKIVIKCDDGKQYTVMIKPKDDLRRDFRLMEFNCLVKRYLNLNSKARHRRLRIRTYAVVPFNEECGLVEWLPNLNSLRVICFAIYRKQCLGISDRLLRTYIVPKTDPIEKKRQVFINILLAKHPPVFHEWFRQRFSTPHSWYEARTSYIKTVAVMSIVGYILGLGDRHGENILFDETNGDAVHVDFNCLFNQGELFSYPEVVPFRLTHNMTFAMGPLKIEGLFRKCCEITLEVLQKTSAILMSVLRPFVYDLIIMKNAGKDYQQEEITDPKALIDVQRIDERLQGYVKKITSISSMPLSIEGQVKLLINEAIDITNLASMYIGWGAFL